MYCKLKFLIVFLFFIGLKSYAFENSKLNYWSIDKGLDIEVYSNGGNLNGLKSSPKSILGTYNSTATMLMVNKLYYPNKGRVLDLNYKLKLNDEIKKKGNTYQINDQLYFDMNFHSNSLKQLYYSIGLSSNFNELVNTSLHFKIAGQLSAMPNENYEFASIIKDIGISGISNYSVELQIHQRFTLKNKPRNKIKS